MLLDLAGPGKAVRRRTQRILPFSPFSFGSGDALL